MQHKLENLLNQLQLFRKKLPTLQEEGSSEDTYQTLMKTELEALQASIALMLQENSPHIPVIKRTNNNDLSNDTSPNLSVSPLPSPTEKEERALFSPPRPSPSQIEGKNTGKMSLYRAHWIRS